MRIILLTLFVLLGGCAIFDSKKPDPVEVVQVECEALRIVKFPGELIKPLDLTEYSSISFAYGEEGGKQIVYLSVDDYFKLLEMLRVVSNHLDTNIIIIKRMKQYYEQNLDRAGLD